MATEGDDNVCAIYHEKLQAAAALGSAKPL